MKKQMILGSMLLLLAGACTQKPAATGSLNIIDVASSFEQPTELKVSQLAPNIRYVPLETTDTSLIGNSPSVKLLKDKIAVMTDKRCLLFDKQSGKFLCEVGHAGNDPEGFSDPYVYFNPYNDLLYFSRQPNKLLKYDQQGNFMGESLQPKTPLRLINLIFSDSLLIGKYDYQFASKSNHKTCGILYYNEQGEKKDSIAMPESNLPSYTTDDIAGISVLKGKNGKEAYGLKGKEGMILINYKNGGEAAMPFRYPVLWKVDGNVHMKEDNIDTIYNIAGTTMKPLYAFDNGKWNCPPEEMGNSEAQKKYIRIHYVMETPEKIFFECKKGEFFYGIYDKKKKTVYINAAKEGIADDLTQFMPFQPETWTEQGEFAALVEAGDVVEWMDEHPDTPKEGKLSFLKEINADSNPVCVILEP